MFKILQCPQFLDKIQTLLQDNQGLQWSDHVDWQPHFLPIPQNSYVPNNKNLFRVPETLSSPHLPQCLCLHNSPSACRPSCSSTSNSVVITREPFLTWPATTQQNWTFLVPYTLSSCSYFCSCMLSICLVLLFYLPVSFTKLGFPWAKTYVFSIYIPIP